MGATGKFVAFAAGVMLATATSAACAQWMTLPSAEDLSHTYPPAALRAHVSGRAVLSCTVTPGGQLGGCQVSTESPADQGFGAAALALVPKFAVDAASPQGAALLGKHINVPIRYSADDGSPPWRELAFKTSQQFPELAGPYYPDKAFRADINGEAVLDCRVAEKGRLQACKVAAVTPTGYYFDEAALKMAEAGWMTAKDSGPDVVPPGDGVWRFQVPFILRHHLRGR